MKMQERRYDKVYLNKKCFDQALSIFELNRLLHTFLEYYSGNNEYVDALIDNSDSINPISTIIDKAMSLIALKKPLIVGFTVLEIQRCFTLYFIRRIRSDFQGKIIIGGADPTRQ